MSKDRAIEIAAEISTRPEFAKYESPLILDIVRATLDARASPARTLALFTANQAQALLDAFGGSPATYALIECKEGDCAPLDDGSPSPAGLYIYHVEYPEEGVIYLGDEDEDSEPRA